MMTSGFAACSRRLSSSSPPKMLLRLGSSSSSIQPVSPGLWIVAQAATTLATAGVRLRIGNGAVAAFHDLDRRRLKFFEVLAVRQPDDGIEVERVHAERSQFEQIALPNGGDFLAAQTVRARKPLEVALPASAQLAALPHL